VSSIYLHPLSFSIIKLDSYARSLRRSDKPPSKIPSLANTSSEKYTNHEGLTSREWYYPRVVAGKSPVLHKLRRLAGADWRKRSTKWAATTLSFLAEFNQPYLSQSRATIASTAAP